MSSPTLTEEHIRHFDEEGYLILRANEHNLVEPSKLQVWTQQVKSFGREYGKWMPYDEVTSTGERQLMRTENFTPYHAGFSNLLHGSALTSVLAQLTREPMVLFKDKINYKLSGGAGFGSHIDAPAYDHIGKIEHTTANLAVDAATLSNGCIEVVPKSHRMTIPLSHGGAITPEWEDSHTWIPVELAPGDLLIFGSHLAHRSGRNETETARASVYATYSMVKDGMGLRERYYEDRRENFPPDHERVPGKDYRLGQDRYAFAAPFTSVEAQSVA